MKWLNVWIKVCEMEMGKKSKIKWRQTRANERTNELNRMVSVGVPCCSCTMHVISIYMFCLSFCRIRFVAVHTRGTTEQIRHSCDYVRLWMCLCGNCTTVRSTHQRGSLLLSLDAVQFFKPHWVARATATYLSKNYPAYRRARGREKLEINLVKIEFVDWQGNGLRDDSSSSHKANDRFVIVSSCRMLSHACRARFVFCSGAGDASHVQCAFVLHVLRTLVHQQQQQWRKQKYNKTSHTN